MYNMEKEHLPSKPAISSFRQAEKDLSQWLVANDFSQISDASGLSWALKVEVQETPSAVDRRKRDWQISITVCANANGQRLVETSTLDLEKDERLLHIIGGATIPMRMRPQVFQAHSIEEARLSFAQSISALRQRFATDHFHTVKRKLCEAYVSEKICNRFSG